jgi:hypothetical protein
MKIIENDHHDHDHHCQIRRHGGGRRLDQSPPDALSLSLCSGSPSNGTGTCAFLLSLSVGTKCGKVSWTNGR